MKIQGTTRTGSINPYNHNDNRATVGKKEKKKDEISISPEAKELLNAQTQKLQELKNAVSTGTYHVDAKKISEKLLPYLK